MIHSYQGGAGILEKMRCGPAIFIRKNIKPENIALVVRAEKNGILNYVDGCCSIHPEDEK